MIELRWLVSPFVSCLHVTDALWRGFELTDHALVGRLEGPAMKLRSELDLAKVPWESFLQHLAPAVAGMESKLQLARLALTKAVGRERTERLALRYQGLLTDLDAAFRAEMPRLNESTPISIPDAKEAWHDHGPILWEGIGRWTEPSMRAEAATIFLVHPLSAFTSAVHSSANTLRVASPPFDALQLAWLLAQLNLDMPRYSDALLGPTRAAQVGALALIPVALAVGEEAKQTELSQPALKKTLLTWLPKCNANTTDTLWQWWEVYRDTRPLWPTALAALDRMLEATVSPPPQTV